MALAIELASIDDLLSGRCGEVAVGDVLAFNGQTKVDQFIQGATRSGISHVGILIRARADGPLLLMEATGKGITATPLGAALESYTGDHTCFYLPLRPASRALVVPATLAEYFATNAQDKYNYDGVVAAGIYDLDHPFFDKLLTHFQQSSPGLRIGRWWDALAGETDKIWREIFGEAPAYRRLFCSQLVADALQEMKVVVVPPPSRLVVPVEVCWFDIYAGAYQLNGDRLLPDPFRWGDAPPGMRAP
jgi:hypothetical protein